MIYAAKERAVEVASMLNERRGYTPSYAFETPQGWTVRCSWNLRIVNGELEGGN